MNKIKLFSLMALGTICVSVGAIALKKSSELIYKGKTSSGVYTANFQMNNFSTTDRWFITANKNKINYRYKNVYISCNKKYFGVDSYFENTSMIKGLQSITVEGLVGELKVEYGWNYCGYQNSATINASNKTFEFNDEYPSYVKIINESNTDVAYTKVSVTYSCSQTFMPSSYVEDLDFFLNDSGTAYSVQKIYGTDPVVLNIPSTYLGKPVTEIMDNAFYNLKNLERISIPDTVTRIGSYAFSGATSLKEASLPNSITSLGNGCFRNTGLEYIKLPENISDVPDYFCYQCGSLKTANLGNAISVNYSSFEQCSLLSNIIFPETLQSIGSFSFDSCTSLKHVRLPSSLTSIGNSSFRRCSALEDFIVPENVQTIGHETFDSDTSLKMFKIGPSVTSIDMTSFCNDSSLEMIFIPSNVTKLGEQVFFGCSKLTIYTEFDDVPSTWHSNWNSQGRPVVYGIKESENKPSDPSKHAYFMFESYKWLHDEMTMSDDYLNIFTISRWNYVYDSTEDGFDYNSTTMYFDKGWDIYVILETKESCYFSPDLNLDDCYLDMYFNGQVIHDMDIIYTMPGDTLIFKYSYLGGREGDDGKVEFEVYHFN